MEQRTLMTLITLIEEPDNAFKTVKEEQLKSNEREKKAGLLEKCDNCYPAYGKGKLPSLSLPFKSITAFPATSFFYVHRKHGGGGTFNPEILRNVGLRITDFTIIQLCQSIYFRGRD